ncbi:DUF3575 domain-containing protein [Pseudopedobacter beijingensis]|uniref:DUF3575 domain-containing protein n=1 Tax=Pseudopedobacter beijingensis TaxID=1207056 RepID=A0ABW4IBK6_9SPHI
MKKLLLIAVIFTAMYFKGYAQSEKNTIKINPISALLRTGSIFYEHKLSDQTSAQLGLAYTGMKLSDTKFSGLALTPEFRFYPKQNAINGLYTAAFLRYQDYKVKDDASGAKGSYSSMGGGILLGRQWVYNSAFTLDIFFGPSINSGKVKADDGSAEPEISHGIDGFGLRAGISLGFAF